MTVKKRIFLSSIGGSALTALNFAVLAIAPTDQSANGTITPRPGWVEVVSFPLRFGARFNKRLFPPDEQVFILFRWSDLIAGLVGAFLFFGILTYIFLCWWPRRLHVT